MSKKFKDFTFRAEILEALEEAGYHLPTPIQQESIPILLTGRDLIGVAETGTGKTLAFLLPIFQMLEEGATDPQGIVICPTRELAIQVAGEAERFGRQLGVRTVLAYGGTSSGAQKQQLAAGCDLVVGTPGRLLDFVTSAWLSMRNVRFAVLDEADRMLDMGFINDVDGILRKTPMSRQTILFSATIPEEVRRLAERYMLHPETVEMHTGTRVTKNVDHAFYPVCGDQKQDLLVELLGRENPAKFLVFTATRESTSEIALVLRRKRFEVISLSSLLSQANRERALDAFRKGECQALVATDVAARGLDITDIDLVVNFDVPMQAEDYVHRIGRTGRAERTGKAITLVSELDERRAVEIEDLLEEGIPRLKLEDFPYRERSRPRGRGGRPAPRRGGGGGGRSGSGSRGTRGRRGRGGKPRDGGGSSTGGSRGGRGETVPSLRVPAALTNITAMSLIQIFKSGGPIMWPLALCSFVALAIIIERLINLRASRILNPTVVERITGLAEGGRSDRAAEVCRDKPGIYTNIVRAGLEIAHKGEAAAKEAIEDAGRHEASRLGRYLWILGTVAGVAPLGLLGTVTGMIEVFKTIAESGAGHAAQLSSGISQALITTATGLLIAIPSLVAHNFFQEKAEEMVTDLERESLRALRGLYHPMGPRGDQLVAPGAQVRAAEES